MWGRQIDANTVRMDLCGGRAREGEEIESEMLTRAHTHSLPPSPPPPPPPPFLPPSLSFSLSTCVSLSVQGAGSKAPQSATLHAAAGKGQVSLIK